VCKFEHAGGSTGLGSNATVASETTGNATITPDVTTSITSVGLTATVIPVLHREKKGLFQEQRSSFVWLQALSSFDEMSDIKSKGM